MKSNPDKATLQNDGKKHEVADIFRRYGEAYRLNNVLPLDHVKVMKHIET